MSSAVLVLLDTCVLMKPRLSDVIIKHMAKAQMAKLGVRVLRPGPFLDEIHALNSTATTRAIQQAAKDLKNPPYTLAELLYVLRKAGAKELVAQVSQSLGVTPLTSSPG